MIDWTESDFWLTISWNNFSIQINFPEIDWNWSENFKNSVLPIILFAKLELWCNLCKKIFKVGNPIRPEIF